MNQHTSRVAWTSLGLLSLVLCVYLPVIAGCGFLWDDHLLLLDNRLVWSPGGLFDIWFSTKNPDYFPLMSTSFWLEARLWGREAWGYHLVNALLHAGSAILLWRIFTRLKIRGGAVGRDPLRRYAPERRVRRLDRRAEKHAVDVFRLRLGTAVAAGRG
jgi:hypothetical protein